MIGQGYEARFEGGCMDGQTVTVQSLMPSRFAMRKAREGTVPAASPPFGVAFDRYDLESHEPAVYRWNEGRSSR